MKTRHITAIGCAALVLALVSGCGPMDPSKSHYGAERAQPYPEKDLPPEHFPQAPLVTHIYTADPSAHVFDGKLYLYPSHDIETNTEADRTGASFNMVDYHVLSLTDVGGAVTDHGPALHIGEVPWAVQQLWAPDAAEKDGQYYLYFPAKDQHGIFRIGVATSDKPQGPFTPEPIPMAGTYSIDPAVFKDDDGTQYLYLGGIRGGQLQRWQTGQYVEEDSYPADNQPTLLPRMARLSDDMLTIAHPLTSIPLLDDSGNLINQGDKERRFFEAPWIHKKNGIYYLSWSTGDSHLIQYATGDNPYGPFQWQGKILEPVAGWTNHHSIAEFKGKWYLFYHDTSLSGGTIHLRTVKMAELVHNEDGTIQTIDAYLGD
ncbi:glycoside hydrolase family 43 protein [Teredinibacter purpureus]|uniref:glycoside hydrolase family 43 protein n=1 Tax=Teredinibacter purpureus TaxID=2731756 RepID=UPI0005F885B2|nr:glycoside hydrolase family 43 protein [Teredinibacter purpureus]